MFSPLYQQIKTLLMQSLAAREWKAGEMIPSEQELAARFKVSQGTVRKAIDELAQEHLVTRRQGKGTFVAAHDEVRTQFRFLRLMPNEGEQTQPASSILACQQVRPPADIAAQLALNVTTQSAILVHRLLSFDGTPAVLDEIWLSAQQFKGLTTERLVQSHAQAQAPLYSLFEQDFGIKMIRAEEKIRAIACDAATAARLHITAGTPILLVERLSYTFGDKPVELRRGYYLTEKHFYRNALN